MKAIQQYLNQKGCQLKEDGIIGRQTKQAATTWLINLCRQLGYQWNERHIVGLRMGNEFTDKFSDFAFIVSGWRVVEIIEWTTKAGKYYVNNPLTVGGITGTGVIKEGQYIMSYQFVTAANKYKSPYFNQIREIAVYRDGNKDNKVDKNIVQKAPSWYAFLLHAMGTGFSIWNWSAGCQGTPLATWKLQVCPYFKDGDIIDYTLLDAESIMI